MRFDIYYGMIFLCENLENDLYNKAVDSSQKNEYDLYVSFRSIHKVGINPRSTYNTPNGIYFYPLVQSLKYYNTHGEGDNKYIDFPFASDEEFAYLIKPKESNVNILYMGNYDKLKYDRDINKLENFIRKNYNKIYPEISSMSMFRDHKETKALQYFLDDIAIWQDESRIKNDIGFIWNITRNLANKIKPNGNSSVVWNYLLREVLGYDIIIDDKASGLIHPNERLQGVILNPKSYNIVAVLQDFQHERTRQINKTKNLNYLIKKFISEKSKVWRKSGFDMSYGLEKKFKKFQEIIKDKIRSEPNNELRHLFNLYTHIDYLVIHSYDIPVFLYNEVNKIGNFNSNHMSKFIDRINRMSNISININDSDQNPYNLNKDKMKNVLFLINESFPYSTFSSNTGIIILNSFIPYIEFDDLMTIWKDISKNFGDYSQFFPYFIGNMLDKKEVSPEKFLKFMFYINSGYTPYFNRLFKYYLNDSNIRDYVMNHLVEISNILEKGKFYRDSNDDIYEKKYYELIDYIKNEIEFKYF